MPCSLDHSKLSGIKFCTECGLAVVPAKRLCTQGHELVRKNKFCEVCGSPEALAGTTSPQITPTSPTVQTTQTFNPAPSFTPPPPPLPATHSTLLPPPPIGGEYPAYVPPERKKLSIIIGAVTAVAILIVGLVVNANKVTYTNVSVSMSIIDQDCWDLSWGYFDIPGAEVVLSVDGAEVSYAEYPSFGTDSILSCNFETTFYDVPTNGSFYEFSMSSGRRGTITKTKEEMVSNGWAFNLTLG